MSTNTETHRKVARVFEDIGGFYYCNASLGFLDTRGRGFKTLRAALESLRQNARFDGYTHYKWGRITRKVNP